MIETVAAPKKSRKKPGTKIPDYLIYEVTSAGQPIYYKGYKDVLNKTKTFEEITMESKLQAWLKARITMMIGNMLINLGYEITTGELGINISTKSKRGADIAVFKASDFTLSAKFTDVAPEVIIEIDTQIELEDKTEIEYVAEKIKDYIAFGVKKVIWIFTKGKLVLVATSELPWLTYDWEANIEVIPGVSFKLNDLVP